MNRAFPIDKSIPLTGVLGVLRFMLLGPLPAMVVAQDIEPFLDRHCFECHAPDSRKGNLDLTELPSDFASPGTFARWVKVHDRIESGEMPPKKKARPAPEEIAGITTSLATSLIAAEKTMLDRDRTGIRRLTRAEYENTIRDLFDLSGIALQNGLPADGSAHGFDKNSDALDLSHVNLAKYLEAADKTLDLAIATRPAAPPKQTVSLSLSGNYEPDIMLMQGDAVANHKLTLLK